MNHVSVYPFCQRTTNPYDSTLTLYSTFYIKILSFFSLSTQWVTWWSDFTVWSWEDGCQRTHPLTNFSSLIHLPLLGLRYPISPIHLVCTRLSPSPSLTRILSLHLRWENQDCYQGSRPWNTLEPWHKPAGPTYNTLRHLLPGHRTCHRWSRWWTRRSTRSLSVDCCYSYRLDLFRVKTRVSSCNMYTTLHRHPCKTRNCCFCDHSRDFIGHLFQKEKKREKKRRGKKKRSRERRRL